MNKDKSKIRKYLENILLIILIILVYVIILSILKISCPIKELFGISCPGCGMTRAVIHGLMFKFDLAFYYHPLWFLLPIIFIVLLLTHYKNKMKIFYLTICITSILFITVYIYRLFYSDNYIVYFKPETGLIYRLFEKIKAFIS